MVHMSSRVIIKKRKVALNDPRRSSFLNSWIRNWFVSDAAKLWILAWYSINTPNYLDFLRITKCNIILKLNNFVSCKYTIQNNLNPYTWEQGVERFREAAYFLCVWARCKNRAREVNWCWINNFIGMKWYKIA